MDIYNKLFQLYNNDSNEYLTSPYKMGISIATYKRKNGKTPEYLTKSLNSILSQTASNWHVYLVGDKYEDISEFNQLASIIPSDKITKLNLSNAEERNHISGKDLWRIGGSNAMNTANKLALDDNCEYILHLDDDDTFYPKKIQLINYILSAFDNPIFIFHYNKHTNTILPTAQLDYLENKITKSQIYPTPGNIVHSSFCIHKSIMENFKYPTYDGHTREYREGDISFLLYLQDILKNDPSKYTIFIPLTLGYKDNEGEILQNGGKKRYRKTRKNKKKTKKSRRKLRKQRGGSNNLKDITIAILSYKSPLTIKNTLESYKKNGLFDLVNTIIYFQEITDKDKALAKEYNIQYMGTNTNIGIDKAFLELVNAVKTPYMIFAENDYELVHNKEETQKILDDTIELFKNDNVTLIKLRDKKNPGVPDYAKNVFESEYINNEQNFPYKIEAFSFLDNPGNMYPNIYITKQYNYNWYILSSIYSVWSNQIFIAKVDWLKTVPLEIIKNNLNNNSDNKFSKLENIMIDPSIIPYNVATGIGLFTHNRLDR